MDRGHKDSGLGLLYYVSRAYRTAKEKGFWDGERQIGSTLMLVVSEISEALEAARKGRFTAVDLPSPRIDSDEEYAAWFKEHVKDTFEDELADALIRIFDVCGKMNIDIERHVLMKMRYNDSRPHKHGKKF